MFCSGNHRNFDNFFILKTRLWCTLLYSVHVHCIVCTFNLSHLFAFDNLLYISNKAIKCGNEFCIRGRSWERRPWYNQVCYNIKKLNMYFMLWNNQYLIAWVMSMMCIHYIIHTYSPVTELLLLYFWLVLTEKNRFKMTWYPPIFLL